MRLEKDQPMKMKRMDVKRVRADLGNIPDPLVGPTVMVVDEDLGLICRLGKILAEAGYQVIPALNSRQAASLMERLRITPDLVIVNPSLMKVNSMSWKARHDVSAELRTFGNRRRPGTGRFYHAAPQGAGMPQGSVGHGA